MFRTGLLITGVAACLGLGAAPAAAQDAEPLYACSTQSGLEQIINSDGDFVPDGCRSLRISVLDTDEGRLCVLQLGQGEGVLERLQDFVSADELWVRCDLLDAEVSAVP